MLAALPQIVFVVAWIASLIFSFRLHYMPFLAASAILAAAWILALAYGYAFGRFRYEVKNVEIAFDDLPQSFDGYRIVQISDLHLDGWRGKAKFSDKIVTKINSLHPDAICFTGDLVSLTHHELDAALIASLRQLHATDGVYSVLGNHDYAPYVHFASERQRAEAVNELIRKEREELGWNLLLNESCVISRGSDSIAILGVENQSCGVHKVIRRGNLKKAMQGCENMFRILLSHDPTHWRAEVLPNTDIPLTLSGHTHAMQMRIFGFSPCRWLYSEYDGLYSSGKQSLYVNIGLGGTLPFRLGASPEITLLTLKRREVALSL